MQEDGHRAGANCPGDGNCPPSGQEKDSQDVTETIQEHNPQPTEKSTLNNISTVWLEKYTLDVNETVCEHNPQPTQKFPLDPKGVEFPQMYHCTTNYFFLSAPRLALEEAPLCLTGMLSSNPAVLI
jgi:hypothetical protein